MMENIGSIDEIDMIALTLKDTIFWIAFIALFKAFDIHLLRLQTEEHSRTLLPVYSNASLPRNTEERISVYSVSIEPSHILLIFDNRKGNNKST